MNKIRILPIRQRKNLYFNEFWKLYEESFPLTERRSLDQQTGVFKKTEYLLDLYLIEDQPAGFISFWRIPEFVFIEHFAIASELRGKGTGSTLLRSFIQRLEVPVILEIEPPSDDLTRQRLRFYEASGFSLNNHDHFQPPYHAGDQPLQLNILSYPHQIREAIYFRFSQFQKNIVMR